MGTADFAVDLGKPLVFQVGHLGDGYQEWVHRPIVTKKGPRFFYSDTLECLTRTKWWVVPLIWLPVAFYSLGSSLRSGRTAAQVGVNAAFGAFAWTLIEYLMHRFLFHMQTTSYWANTVHYFLHGFHHKHPMDELRLVFAPAATAVLCVPFWYLAKLVGTPSTAPALFGGGLLGYVVYDCTHYYLHHGQPSTAIAKYLKKNHLDHHFRTQNKGFGVTSTLWDAIFTTLASSDKKIVTKTYE